jgi:hypothetical protein
MGGPEAPAAGPSLAGRFAAAIALTVGFYLLALALAAGLLAAAILPWVLEGRNNVRVTLTGLGLGLPLLQFVSERGLRGIVAHELGHYAGGDTRLGPWIYRTRATIGRTLHHLTSGAHRSRRGSRRSSAPRRSSGRAPTGSTRSCARARPTASTRTPRSRIGCAHSRSSRPVSPTTRPRPPRCSATCPRSSRVLEGVSAVGLGAAVGRSSQLAGEVQRREPDIGYEDAAALVPAVLRDGLLLALDDAGWEVTANLAEPVLCRHAGQEVVPSVVVAELYDKTLDADAWAAQTRELGVADLSLERPAAVAAAR